MKEKRLGESYCQLIFATESFEAMKKVMYNIVMVIGENGSFSAVSYAKGLHLLRLRCGRGCKEREMVFV